MAQSRLGKDAILVPIGTTAERPSSPEAGQVRFNTNLDNFEGYDGAQWSVIGGAPPGAVFHFAMTSAPSGFLKANGAAVSRTTFAALFAVIGTTFGAGDGSTTFNLPDARGRVFVSPDESAGRVTNFSTTLGDTGGADQHQLTVSEMPSHNHTYRPGRANNTANGCGGLIASSSGGDCAKTTDSTGGNQSHNNMSPFITLLACIKF